METAVGILLLCALELEICPGRGKIPPPSCRQTSPKNCCRDKG